MKRILFTSVGRRVELMRAFKAAALRLDLPLQIWGADITDSAPALLYCDKTVKVCGISNPNYIPMLLELCQKEEIDALVPTIDTDLLILSQHKEEFLKIGTRVIISDEEKIKLCRDKRFTADYFKSLGLSSPSPTDDYTKYSDGYPAFIKPKDGSSSIFAYKVNNFSELKTYAEQVPDYIIQPYIDGTEYTVDIFCDFEGNPIYITPRIRLAVRAGEVLKTEICQDEGIISEIKELIKDYKPCGAITVQLIKHKDSGENYYIEINPRFGGGAPMTMKAGADSAEALLRLLNGEKLSYCNNSAADGGVYSRFDQTACVKQGKMKVKCVVFDLDDTLFSEKDYVKSGYRAIAEDVPQIDGMFEKLWEAFELGKKAIDYVLESEGLYSEELKNKCLEIYRNHKPDISLDVKAITLLKSLREKGIKTGIITDGRPKGQRNKIEVLGLDKLVDEIIVTDELGGEKFRKPNDIAFRIMQCRVDVPFANMVYVGDNPAKDFIAPLQLGMQAVHFKNSEGLYSTQCHIKSVDSIDDLAGIIF